MNNYQMFRKIQEQAKIYNEYDNFDREDLIDELVEEKRINENNLELINKQKEVLDKIKEYITTRTPSDIGICGNEPKKYYTLNEDEVDYILELLEEIE